MNFLRILKRVCTDPSVFQELAEFPLYRAMLHLLILAVLLSCMVFFGQYLVISKLNPSRINAAVTAEFGGFNHTPSGIKPTRNPDQPRDMALTNNFLVSYFPGPDLKPEMLKLNDYDRGIVWTPGLVLMWQKKGPSDFTIMPLLGSSDSSKKVILSDIFASSPQEIVAFIHKYYYTPVSCPFSLQTLLQGWVWSFLGLISMVELLRVIWSVLLFNSMFTGCYSIAGGAAATGLTFRKIFIIGLYSGFPALIVASCFSAFDLPLLDFSTIYLFGFLGYFLMNLSRIQRKRLRAGRIGQEDDNDDDER